MEKPAPTVTAALIVRNEELTLGRCLQSIAGAVDEIVLVDTGSTDNTKAVAASHGARILDFPWRDDFAAARQYSFDNASGDWVFWLDADDVVVGAGSIREAISSAPADIGGFFWLYVLGRDSTHAPTFTYWRERCVRNDRSSRWVGRVHEVLVSAPAQRLVRSDTVVVEHHPDSRRPQKGDRNLRILQDECAKGDVEPRMLFYLGREYADHGEVDCAIDTLGRYAQVSQWKDERYLAEIQIGDLLRSQGKYGKATESYLAAMQTHPAWPDSYFGLAATSYFLGQWDNVIAWTEVARSRPRPDTQLFVNHRNYAHAWIIYYTNALYHAGRVQEALEWSRTALTIAPGDAWHEHNVRFLTSVLMTTPD